jgi:hypothetical protein
MPLRPGQCLVAGKHMSGSVYARECPLRAAEQRSARSRKAAATRRQRRSVSRSGSGKG